MIQLAGIHINGISVFALIMSIGLIVDYIMHVLLQYYEAQGSNRNEKTIETLGTVGTSVLAGGLSTFLGTMPLAFSTSEVFYTIFIVFLSLVIVGLAHGLVLLPVILSIFGPTESVEKDLHNIEFNRNKISTSTAVNDQSFDLHHT